MDSKIGTLLTSVTAFRSERVRTSCVIANASMARTCYGRHSGEKSRIAVDTHSTSRSRKGAFWPFGNSVVELLVFLFTDHHHLRHGTFAAPASWLPTSIGSSLAASNHEVDKYPSEFALLVSIAFSYSQPRSSISLPRIKLFSTAQFPPRSNPSHVLGIPHRFKSPSRSLTTLDTSSRSNHNILVAKATLRLS